MNQSPPQLIYEDLVPTRDYLRDVALTLSGLQRAFLPPHPRDWQYGLEVTMRGISTQAFTMNNEEIRASVDLVRNKVRLPGSRHWSLDEYDGPELYKNVMLWLTHRAPQVTVKQPKFRHGSFNEAQAAKYAEALWWMDKQFRALKARMGKGPTSPILLYPHHFDLALTWFPFDDDRQLSIGFSSGDATIAEPYVYITASPEPVGFTDLALPNQAYWQRKDFSGAILPYVDLSTADNPETLFVAFARLFQAAALMSG